MKTQIRHALTTGIVTGIILIFLVLIGFHATAADLIGTLLDFRTGRPILGLTPLMIDMLLLFAMLGIWNGSRGAKKHEPDSLSKAVTGGLVAGAVAGVLFGLLAYVIGLLNQMGVRMTLYLASLIPGSVRLFGLNLEPVQTGLLYLVLLIVTGLIGALLAYSARTASTQRNLKDLWKDLMAPITRLPVYREVTASRYTKYVFYGLLLVAAFLLPLRLGQYWNYTVGTIGIYVLLGLGLNIVVGLAGLLDLGYVAFFAIGAYTIGLLTSPQPHNLQWGFWTVLPIAIVFAALSGILLGIPVLRMRGDYLAIVTLGFGEIIRILSRSDLLASFSGGPRGVRNIASPTLFGQPFNSPEAFVYMILISCLLIIFVTNRLKNSRVGRAWVAMREDEVVARASGINILTHKLLAFAVGAAFAGLGGALFASRNAFTGPEDHNLMVSINVLALVIVGGMGSIPGVIAGAFVLKGLPEILRQLDVYRVLFFGGLLVFMMIIRPEGIIPSRRRRLELAEEQEIEPEPAHPESASVEVADNIIPTDLRSTEK